MRGPRGFAAANPPQRVSWAHASTDRLGPVSMDYSGQGYGAIEETRRASVSGGGFAAAQPPMRHVMLRDGLAENLGVARPASHDWRGRWTHCLYRGSRSPLSRRNPNIATPGIAISRSRLIRDDCLSIRIERHRIVVVADGATG